MRHALVLVVIACSRPVSAPAPAPVPAPVAPVAPAPPAEEPVDQGEFVLTVAGQSIGDEEFTIARRGEERVVRSKTRLVLGGGKLTMSMEGVLTVDASWRPIAGEWSVDRGGTPIAIRLAREDGALVQSSGGTTARESKPSDLFALSNVMAHFSSVCALAGEAERRFVLFPGLDVSLSPRAPRRFEIQEGGVTIAREHDVVQATLATTSRFSIACEGDKLIAVAEALQGFVAARKGFERIAETLATRTREKPALPEGLVEEERTVTVPAQGDDAEAVLSCSLLRPAAKKKKLPAVAFFTGSGGQDRDEDSPGPAGLKLSIFKVLAIALAREGVASLRCDDRGVAKSTGDASAATLTTFVRDGEAMVAALRRETKLIDPKRVGFIGHSEGGVVALAVGASDPKLKAIVIMAGTGRPLDEVLLHQVAHAMRLRGSSDEEIRVELERRRVIHAAIRDGQPLPDVVQDDERAAFDAASRWLRSHFQTDPVKLAARISRKTSVLVAQGDKDFQVSVGDAEALRDALTKAGVPVETRIYAGLNHLFSVSKTGGLADYADPDARVDPGFIEDLVRFVRAKLGGT